MEEYAKYGLCDRCGAELIPIRFEEEETIVEYGHIVHTGRKRIAVSHLTCPYCFKNFPIDDSFDGSWYK